MFAETPGNFEDSIFLGNDDPKMGNWIPMFRGNVAFSLSVTKTYHQISESDYPVSICHIPEVWNPQLYHSKTLKTHIQRTLFIYMTYSQVGH
jgi:hypothetical protein